MWAYTKRKTLYNSSSTVLFMSSLGLGCLVPPLVHDRVVLEGESDRQVKRVLGHLWYYYTITGRLSQSSPEALPPPSNFFQSQIPVQVARCPSFHRHGAIIRASLACYHTLKVKPVTLPPRTALRPWRRYPRHHHRLCRRLDRPICFNRRPLVVGPPTGAALGAFADASIP